MNRDNAAVTRRRVLAEHELLMTHLGDRIEELHLESAV
jgi:hypothetical protein